MSFKLYEAMTVTKTKRRSAPRVGLEPTTTRLTAECSTIELSRNNQMLRICCEFLPLVETQL